VAENSEAGMRPAHGIGTGCSILHLHYASAISKIRIISAYDMGRKEKTYYEHHGPE